MDRLMGTVRDHRGGRLLSFEPNVLRALLVMVSLLYIWYPVIIGNSNLNDIRNAS